MVIFLKRYGWIGWSLLVLAAIVLKNADDMVAAYPLLAALKYCSAAGAMIVLPIVLFTSLHVPRITRCWLRRLCFYSGYALTLFYMFLTLDTYMFHVWTWYPGILRYALFDAYSVLYVIFIIPGGLLYGGSREVFA